jgi:hypothetical protein
MHGPMNIKFVVYTLQRNVRHLFFLYGSMNIIFIASISFVILGPKTKANDGKAIDSMMFVFMCEG